MSKHASIKLIAWFPRGARIEVTMMSGQVVHTTAAGLMSYPYFQATVLAQLGEPYHCRWITQENSWGDVVRRYIQADEDTSSWTTFMAAWFKLHDGLEYRPYPRTMIRHPEVDRDGPQWAAFLAAWFDEFGPATRTVGEFVILATDLLKDAIPESVGYEGDRLFGSKIKLGKALSRETGLIYGEYTVVRSATPDLPRGTRWHHPVRWSVQSLAAMGSANEEPPRAAEQTAGGALSTVLNAEPPRAAEQTPTRARWTPATKGAPRAADQTLEHTAKMAAVKKPPNRVHMVMVRIARYQERPEDGVGFAVTMDDGQVVRTTAARLLSYQDFQADVLEQLGEPYRCTWITEDNPWDSEVRRYLIASDGEANMQDTIPIKEIVRLRERPEEGVRFAVTTDDGRVVRTTAARLLSYQDFQADALEQLGEVLILSGIREGKSWENRVWRLLQPGEAE